MIDSLHRNVSLLALVFLGVHILTSVLDSFAPISLMNAIIPFTGSYRPFWLGLGAVAFDLMLAVVITSLLRERIGYTHLARGPLAHLRDLADRARPRPRHGQRRQQQLAAGAQRAVRAGGAGGGAQPRAERLAGRGHGTSRGARRHRGLLRSSCSRGCRSGRSAPNGRGARAPPAPLLGHSATTSKGSTR